MKRTNKQINNNNIKKQNKGETQPIFPSDFSQVVYLFQSQKSVNPLSANPTKWSNELFECV